MAERCEIYMPLLHQFAHVLQGCSLEFRSGIAEELSRANDTNSFPNHGAHLEYIRDKLIAVGLFDRCSSYKFNTKIMNIENGSIDIAGLLAIEAIKRCNRVEIVSSNLCLSIDSAEDQANYR